MTPQTKVREEEGASVRNVREGGRECRCERCEGGRDCWSERCEGGRECRCEEYLV